MNNCITLEKRKQLWKENSNEELLLFGNTEVIDSAYHHMYGIYQMKAEEYKCFLSIHTPSEINLEMFDLVYTAPIETETGDSVEEMLEDIFQMFNIAHPEGYYGRSLSVSDIVVIRDGNDVTAYYVQGFGYMRIPVIREVCTYPDWKIVRQYTSDFPAGRLIRVFEENDNIHIEEVEEVKRILPLEYDDVGIEDIMSMCEEKFDYSGELDDLSGYCFWKIK